MKNINKLTNGATIKDDIFLLLMTKFDSVLHSRYENNSDPIKKELFDRMDNKLHSKYNFLNSLSEESSSDESETPVNRGNLLVGEYNTSLNGISTLSIYPSWVNDMGNYTCFGEYTLFHDYGDPKPVYYLYNNSHSGRVLLQGTSGYFENSSTLVNVLDLIEIVNTGTIVPDGTPSGTIVVTPSVVNLLDPQGNELKDVVIYENPPMVEK